MMGMERSGIAIMECGSARVGERSEGEVADLSLKIQVYYNI